jgi:hypothetical protein
MSIISQTRDHADGGAPAPEPFFPDDVRVAIFALVGKHTADRYVAVYPLAIPDVVGIHFGGGIITEVASEVCGRLRAALSKQPPRTWLVVDTEDDRMWFAPTDEALSLLYEPKPANG